jgi:hypothetical protein
MAMNIHSMKPPATSNAATPNAIADSAMATRTRFGSDSEGSAITASVVPTPWFARFPAVNGVTSSKLYKRPALIIASHAIY